MFKTVIFFQTLIRNKKKNVLKIYMIIHLQSYIIIQLSQQKPVTVILVKTRLSKKNCIILLL